MKTIKIRCCTEDFISRIPGLFAYIEYDEYGNAVLHKATDSDFGCYGKYIENIKYKDKDGNDVYYSFRTLYNKYYDLKKKNEDELSDYEMGFIYFFEKGIGKKEVDETKFSDEQDLVTSVIYLSTAKRKYTEMSDLKKIHDYFYNNKDKITEKTDYDNLLCVACKYKRKGGDDMLDFLKECVEEAESIAKEYYNLAAKEENDEKCSYNVNVFLPNTFNDIGILTDYVDEWVPGQEYKRGEMVFHEGQTLVCDVDVSTGEYNGDLERIVFPENDFKHITEIDKNGVEYSSKNVYGSLFPEMGETYGLSGYTDSKLRSLRRFQDYQNDFDSVETSNINEDWLYYYRTGVVHYRMENDELGNIITVDYNNEYDGTVEQRINNLMLYGSGIETIEVNKDERTITFKYYENAHLSCVMTNEETDDDGNMYYYFSDFQVDKKSEYGKNHGVWYTDVYTYEEGSDLEKLINGEIEGITFEEYINPENVSIDNTKYEFSTVNCLTYKERMIGNDKYDTCHIISEFETNVKNDLTESYSFNSVMKQDYLMGITYQPVKDIDVRILRGNNAAFEKHLKLGEVKSLSDLENYSNGGFYKIEDS